MQLLWVTVLGPGVNEDSYGYLDTTWALLHGYGFLREGKPMTHFAPAYPVLLATAYIAVRNLVQVARWLSVFFYGVNIALMAAIAYVASEGNVLAPLISPLTVMLSGELLVVYSTAASEGPFIAFALATFLLLSMHIGGPRRRLLVCAAVCLGAAMATRYVGITLLPAAVACLWFLDERPPSRRMRDCFLLILVSSLPLGAWLIRNLIIDGSPTDRPLVFHPVSLDDLKVMVIDLCNFYFPVQVNPWLKLAVLSSIAAVLGRHLSRQRSGVAAKTVLLLIVVFCAIYLPFLVVSMSFFDAFTTQVEYPRILAPVAVFVMTLSIALGVKLALTADRVWVRWLSAAFVFSVLAANAPEHWRIVTNLHRNGYYYSQRKWQESETVAFVRSIPLGVTVYTNDPQGIEYRLGRRMRMLPLKINPLSRAPVHDFAQSLRLMCDDVARGLAIVVFLNEKRWYLPSAQELQTACGFEVTRRLADGVVLGPEQKGLWH